MDPRAKRTIRLVVALGTAVLLAAALVYTSFGAASEATTPAKVVDAPADGRSYQLTGKVMPGYSRGATSSTSACASAPVAYRSRFATRESCPTPSARGAR